ncbi:MAG TPA: trypsin-like serine protease [Burkholderiaceae bacterium]|nr:trypsin-like serine protease [Burkholderiaceae bacterium]
MRKTIATILCASIGALAAPAFAITNNWVNDNEHPYVGLIVFYDENGEFLWRCSGSLISPTKFLTAGHCTDTAEGARSARVYFQQDAGANFNPATGVDPITGYPETCAPGTFGSLCMTASTQGQIHNYGFANFAGFPNTRDAGVVILDQGIMLPEYGQLPPAGTLDGLDTARGQKDTVITVSGYGLTLSVEPHSALSNISFRSRLMAKSSLTNLNSANNDGFNVQTQGNGSGRGGTCSGDSGGPVFLGGFSSNLIVAVTSFGLNHLCRGADFGYRIDRTEVLEWINTRQ